ncbi:RNA-binding protein [Candidatus Uhrbacteria bacterium]|nr:RNA-binding protein [Candidatus Uhrbacteria bacterium]
MATRLYIGNLSYTTNDEELRDAFAQSGSSLISAQVVMDKFTGRSRGFGFVEYDRDEDAQAAISMWDGKDLGGRPLRVNVARPKEERAPRRDFGGGNDRY